MSVVTHKHTVSESLVLRDLAQMKALSDPLRQRLLRAFAAAPQTTKQVAHCLKENPTKLYHHVETLVQARLIKLVETRQKRGTTERYYRAAAKQFSVDRNIFRYLRSAPKAKASSAEAVFESAFSGALGEIRQSLNPKFLATPERREKAALLQAEIRATPKQAAVCAKSPTADREFCARFKKAILGR